MKLTDTELARYHRQMYISRTPTTGNLSCFRRNTWNYRLPTGNGGIEVFNWDR